MDTAIVPIQPDLPADIPALLDHLAETQPTVALAIAHALGSESMPALRPTVRRVTEVLESEACLDEEIEFIVSRAVTAQETFENWSDDRIDALLFELSRLFAENAEQLAAATVRETGMGKVTDKTIKNRFASQTVYQSLAGRIAQGPLSFDVARRVTEIAGSMGVVFAVAPVTSPIATAIFKTLITLKGRNALILSFPRQALGVGQLAGGMVRDVLAEHGAPAALVQWVQLRGNRKATRRFMGHPKVAMVLATGSASLVRAAYSSGTPAIGVGPGNAPAWICADADLDQAARLIVSSKTFDNGLICGAEHNLVVDDRVLHPFTEALKKYGAAVLVQDEEPRFYRRGIHTQSRRLRREFIGQSADVIAALIGIPRPVRDPASGRAGRGGRADRLLRGREARADPVDVRGVRRGPWPAVVPQPAEEGGRGSHRDHSQFQRGAHRPVRTADARQPDSRQRAWLAGLLRDGDRTGVLDDAGVWHLWRQLDERQRHLQAPPQHQADRPSP